MTSATPGGRGGLVGPTRPADGGKESLRDAAAEDIPARIGRYVVDARLGEGGTGVVYSAYDPELDRRIAVKWLHDAAGSSRARTIREARALAKLSHPNVVGVHDVIVADDRVCIAMEYVEGRTLEGWLAEEARPWRDVVAVLAEAGRGLAAAHDAGLVHRDFKPQNVMVREDGRVLVMDFGLARHAVAAEERTAPHTVVSSDRLTQTGAIAGTPLYMAPEQLRGDAGDASSDQFAFCVTLFQALYGTLPFDAKTITGLAEQTSRRDVVQRPRGHTVPGWLDDVVLRGLEPAPPQRHPSMSVLVDAITPRSRGRWLGWASAVAVGVVSGGLWLARDEEADRCPGEAALQAELWSEADRATLDEVFAGRDEPYADAAWKTARASLDDYAAGWASARVETCTAGRSGVDHARATDRRRACLEEASAAFTATVDLLGSGDGTVARRAVDLTDALPRLEVCADVAALLAEVDPPDDPEQRIGVERHRQRLAELAVQFAAGDFRDADGILEHADAYATEIAYPPLRGRVEVARGRRAIERGDVDAAVAAYVEAYARAEAGGDDNTRGEALILLLGVIAGSEARDEAPAWERVARGLGERRRWAPATWARFHYAVALLRRGQGKLADARREAERVVEACRELERPSLQVKAASLIATTWLEDARPAPAIPHLEEALQIATEREGPNHPVVAGLRYNLGNARARTEDAAGAMAEYREAGRIWGAVYPDAAHYRAITNVGMARAATTQGDLESARAAYLEAIEAWQDDRIEVAVALHNLAAIERQRGDGDAAAEHAQRELEIVRRLSGEQHPDAADAHVSVGAAAAMLGDTALAEQSLRRAVEIFDAVLEPDSPRGRPALQHLARLLEETGREEEAARLRRGLDPTERDADRASASPSQTP